MYSTLAFVVTSRAAQRLTASYSSHSRSFGILYGSTWQYQQQSSFTREGYRGAKAKRACSIYEYADEVKGRGLFHHQEQRMYSHTTEVRM